MTLYSLITSSRFKWEKHDSVTSSLFPLHLLRTTCSAWTPTSKMLQKHTFVSLKIIQQPWRYRAPLIRFYLLWSTPSSHTHTTQRGLSLVSEDFLFVAVLWPFSWLSLLIFIKYSHYAHMRASILSCLQGSVVTKSEMYSNHCICQILYLSSKCYPFEKVRRGKKRKTPGIWLITSVECDMLLEQWCIKLKRKSVWRVTPTRSVSWSRLIVHSDRI